MITDDKTFSSFYLYNEHKELNCRLPKTIFLQFKKYRLNLLNGIKIPIKVEDFIEELHEYKLEMKFPKPIVIHLFYEFGFLCNDLADLIEDKKPLALFIEYTDFETRDILKYDSSDIFEFDGLTIPHFEDYHKKFEKVYTHLIDGNCYQVNLTIPIILRMKEFIEPKQILQHV